MSAKGKIGIFIAVFCAIMIIPFLVNAGNKSEALELDLNTPEINALANKACVEDTEYMRSHHMQMLDQWRDEVVRGGSTQYVSSTGQVYDKSLDDTCLRCHSNAKDFCTKCHENANVELYCWDCHGTSDTSLQSGK